MPARRLSFWLKVALAVGVVAAGDVALFEARGIGANLGILLTAVTLALAIANPAIRRHRLAAIALVLALPLALLPFERPSFVGFLLWSLAMAVAALAPRAPRGEDGLRWAQRLVMGGLKALIGPPWDLRRWLKVRARSRPLKVTAVILAAVLPIVGGLVFLQLFTVANPVIAQAFQRVELARLDVGRIVFWGVIALPVWAVLRPRGLKRTLATPGLDGDLNLPGVTTASVTVSLMVFNAVFLLQNGLDIAYLWSGAGLPDGVTFADYAHKGAYALIATALLAGLFVVVFLRPGSATAARPLVRWLVIAWVAQNLFLVASTALRTLDYVDAYSLTGMRIAALFWMGLVAIGLALILWRLIAGRSASWLLNRNLAAVGAVLALCGVIDLNAIVASWNVRHAREVGGHGVELDDAHLSHLGGAAIVSLAELEARSPDPLLRARAAHAREHAMEQVHQADWRSWRWRDARRLARVEELLAQPPSPTVRSPPLH